MNAFYVLNVTLKQGDDAFGEGNGAVAFAFSIADDDLVVGEVDVFDAESEAFHEPEPGAEEELGHQFGSAVHVLDDGERLGL